MSRDFSEWTAAFVSASALVCSSWLTACAQDPVVSASGSSAAVEDLPRADPGVTSPPAEAHSPEPLPLHAGAFESVSIHQGKTPSLIVGPDATLWAAFEHEGHVYVTRSIDRGTTFGRYRAGEC